VRGCPACLRTDAEASDLPPHLSMAIRGNWLPKHSTYCHLHGCSLVDLWKESNLTRRLDTSERLKEIASAILSGEMDICRVSVAGHMSFSFSQILSGTFFETGTTG
jgi:hypothetical protein